MIIPEMSWICEREDAGMSKYTLLKYRVHSGNLMIPVMTERKKVMISPQSIR